MKKIIEIYSGEESIVSGFIKALRSREENVQKEVNIQVEAIIDKVKEQGDTGLLQYTNKFDSTEINSTNMLVTDEEIKEAYKNCDVRFIEALKKAKMNIEEFHQKQKNNSWLMQKDKGVILGQCIRALERVGIYVPGGTAAYPSSVLMNTVPAKVAGVDKIIMVTPPLKNGKINPNILVAADIAGVDKIYKAGGAQAIAALAFGTESIEKVDKIVGPGNIYVAMAKKSVYGTVAIDMIAGPSEILIIADEKANPKFLAADLMSQAEHDELASSILVTTSRDIALKVIEELNLQVETLERKEIIKKALKQQGAIIVVNSLKEAIEVSNKIAPEHLELCVENPFNILGEIKNAGSVFLGDYSPEPLGDYMAGPNHVLPTSGTSRFFSPLSVDDYIKKFSFINYSKQALLDEGKDIIVLANTEGLTAHANSIKVRMDEGD